MATNYLELLKEVSTVLASGKCPVNHTTFGEAQVVGIRVSSDITDHLELYIKCKDGRHFWVDKTQLKFIL